MRPSTRSSLVGLAALVASLVLAACGGGGDDGDDEAQRAEGSDGGTEVAIENFEFAPERLDVEAGSTVRWTNEDDAIHSVEDDGDLGYASEELSQGDTYEQRFDEPGEYPYHCGVHDYMKATVVVE